MTKRDPKLFLYDILASVDAIEEYFNKIDKIEIFYSTGSR